MLHVPSQTSKSLIRVTELASGAAGFQGNEKQ